MASVNMWLDDIRPPPPGYSLVKTVGEAIAVLMLHDVERCSLDHDLGACEKCMQGKSPEQWLAEANYQSMPNCEHFGTGYELVCWMEANNVWPKHKPAVHSANPAGRARMQAVIDKQWGKP